MIAFEDAIVELLEEMLEGDRKLASSSGKVKDLRRHFYHGEVVEIVKKHAANYKRELEKQIGLVPAPKAEMSEDDKCKALSDLNNTLDWGLVHRCPEGDKPCCKLLGGGRHLMIFAKRQRDKGPHYSPECKESCGVCRSMTAARTHDGKTTSGTCKQCGRPEARSAP